VRRAKQFLYPTELVALLACEDVDLEWRRLIALAVYLYPRAGELEALEWEDVDLERGIVHIHRGIDRERGGTKGTKTGLARRFAVERAALPLLQVLHDDSGGVGHLVPRMPRMRDLAEGLRNFLHTAGVTRYELHHTDRTRKALTWHDLRATGITWMAIRGDDPLHIQHRAGHTSFATTQGYIRQAEAVRTGFGNVFPSLGMLTQSTERSNERSKMPLAQSWRRGIYSRKLAERAGFESDKKGRVGHSRVAKGPQRQAPQETPGSPLRSPQPKPEESNTAIVAAIKAALDEGRNERAAALFEVLACTAERAAKT
jgi:hypothetical protein